jgi:hypothetical protein
MIAITELRGTAWRVDCQENETYADPEGHTWFSLDIAREIAQRIDGLPVRSTTRSRKRTVIRYEGDYGDHLIAILRERVTERFDNDR